MDLIFYSTVAEGDRKKLEALISKFIPLESVSPYFSLAGLETRLKQPAVGEDLILLAPGSREELQKILGMAGFLGDQRIIVVAPDRQPETIATSHRLRPRFLAYLNDDWETLEAVLEKIFAGSRDLEKEGGRT